LVKWVAAVALVVAACAGADVPPVTTGVPPVTTGAPPRSVLVAATAAAPTIVDGDDWSMPDSARPAANSGFFSERASPDFHVTTRSVDVSWRQIQPTDGDLDLTASGSAQGMSFGSLSYQLDTDPGPYWMRIFASGVDWAPRWVSDSCSVSGEPLPTYGPDYDGMRHLPIWDDCVWGHLMDTYRKLFVDRGLRADPNLRFIYVPGAFTWAEFDYEMITDAVDKGDLDFAAYHRWYQRMITDLVGIFGEFAYKLVFTGEDYPFGPFGPDDDLLAKEAVDGGMGVRTGITELSNFHLNDAPAYGSRIQPNGHLAVDAVDRDPRRVFATENECFNDCGYTTTDPYYAVRQANLKALQLQMNWIYVVEGPSYLKAYADHWDWVRLELGQTAATSSDAWAALRDAEDTYWNDDTAVTWKARPFVRNLERWLVQVDRPGCVAHRSDVDVHTEVFAPENGTAYEGLSTSAADGDVALCFQLDPAFAAAMGDDVLVKVTYVDGGSGSFEVVDSAGTRSAVVSRVGDGKWKTATVAMPAANLAEFRVAVTGNDLTVRFARVVRTA
jgi:hypothetical protein